MIDIDHCGRLARGNPELALIGCKYGGYILQICILTLIRCSGTEIEWVASDSFWESRVVIRSRPEGAREMRDHRYLSRKSALSHLYMVYPICDAVLGVFGEPFHLIFRAWAAYVIL